MTPGLSPPEHPRLFKGIPIYIGGVQRQYMGWGKVDVFKGGKEGKDWSLYQLQASTGKESDGRDDGNDGKPNEHALTASAAADHYCSTMQSRTPRLNANSGTAASEGTVVLKLEETPSDDDLGQVVGQTVAPATQLLSGAAPIEAKSLRGKNQTPVNDELNPSRVSTSSQPKHVGGRKGKGESNPEVVDANGAEATSKSYEDPNLTWSNEGEPEFAIECAYNYRCCCEGDEGVWRGGGGTTSDQW
ncbi:hypothetical protein F5J12DRAFT_781343 [Pisolithus orientalis]|uniref:uncharacterized protein n=1 Tax=Pisolithus orientalis TaxID=936130 RepID=UPI0022256A5F|nr:uncharacterized protein F5J12DRAFT_781343 [Pisolithus orientalis]KAI6015350.1 hypothetical protein F5J12DRAFT_781343 [Pisolithus orientalis]